MANRITIFSTGMAGGLMRAGTGILLALFLILPFSEVRAQTSAGISATANVISGVMIEEVQVLDFNNILRGMTKTVDAADASVTVSGGINPGFNEEQGVFAVLAENSTELILELVLPNVLNGTGDNSGETIPISFAKEGDVNNFFWVKAGSISQISNETRNEFNTIDTSGDRPVSTVQISDFEGTSINTAGVTGNGVLVAIGGTVTANPNQSFGLYSGTIRLNATVTD